MLSNEANERITRVGPTTPAGKLLRSYWQPLAVVDEFADGKPLRPVTLLGEKLVLFRDEAGRYGLLDRDCPHRGADLSYGRLEDGGLRCLFHGWLFDVNGRCLQTPAEPSNSRLCDKVRQRAYPVTVRGQIIWGYLGEGEPPAFADIDPFVAPDSHVFAFKGLWECNWLQALEVGIDPSHASYLHQYFVDEEPTDTASYGRQFRSASSNSNLPMTKVLREYGQPDIQIEPTPWGQRLLTLRRIDDERTHVRVTNTIFPQAFSIPMSDEITITQWHVPIDDTNTYWYTMFTSFGKPIDKAHFRDMRLKTYPAPDYKPIVNARNRYGFDAEEQRTLTYTGMGMDINVHDQWACESQGAIQDRTREHLGVSDKGIISYRKMLNEAINTVERGGRPLMALDETGARQICGPAVMDGLGPTEGWQQFWVEVDRRRRAKAPWPQAANAA